MSAEHESFVAVSNGMIPNSGGLITRREAMARGLLGAAGMLMADRLCSADSTKPASTGSGAKPAKAKAVIQIWLSGGPTHTDTFDPKPQSGSDYTGPLNHPIETNVKGILIGESMPQLAKVADKYALIRSMTHRQNGHETASYMVQTGRMPGGRLVFPMVGAAVTAMKPAEKMAGSAGLIPPYIVMTQPQGRFSESGFLGIRYKPFATGGDPNAF